MLFCADTLPFKSLESVIYFLIDYFVNKKLKLLFSKNALLIKSDSKDIYEVTKDFDFK